MNMYTLNDLPVEILEHILSFLRLDDWKQASLVCQKWMLLCSSRKSLADVVLTLVPEKCDKAELCRVLSGSIRQYRNIMFEVYEDDDYVIPTILEAFQESLQCVKIKGYYEMVLNLKMDYLKKLFGCTVKLKELRIQTFIDIEDPPEDGEIVELPTMPYLETLYLEFESLERAYFDWTKIAPNVKQLYIAHNKYCTNFNQLMRFYSHQLSSLGIAMDGKSYYAFGVEPVEFPQLRNLTVTCWDAVGLDRVVPFFRSFPPNLTELTLGFNMVPEVLSSVIVSFPSLETLRLYLMTSEDGFQLLSKLPKLKHLFICRATISYSDLALGNCFNSLQQLSLKYVDIVMAEEFFKLLSTKMPNLTDLEITDDGNNEASYACKNLTNLRRLTILFECDIKDYFCCCNLQYFKHLRELRLFCYSHEWGRESEDFIWMSFTRCDSVRKLLIPDRMIPSFSSEERKTSHWQAIAERFPFLETLEISRAAAKRADVEIIRRLFPNCEVRILSNRVAFQSEDVDATLQFEMAI